VLAAEKSTGDLGKKCSRRSYVLAKPQLALQIKIYKKVLQQHKVIDH